MKFRTEIKCKKSEFPISYDKPVILMGSCFTDNIGTKFRQYLFRISINPFGVMYNPLSISKGIVQLLEKNSYTNKDLNVYNDLFFSFDHYTRFSGTDERMVLDTINRQFYEAKLMLADAGFLILTFGTAYVFERKENGELVNNCHKIPASKFNRRLLSVNETVENYSNLIEKLQSINPGLKIIFTVSPVRHIKDGLIENQRSKSSLILSIKELEMKYKDCCLYFPSYEILMDDLRDYRYYTSDLLHPNDQAMEYIWNIFYENMLHDSARKIINELIPLINAAGHRPDHPDTPAYKKFSKEANRIRKKMEEKYPYLQWSELSKIYI